MDKILNAHVIRSMVKLEANKQQTFDNEENQYLIYPEPQSIDSDEKINPYSPV
jgi:hypothetical protein